MKSKNTEFTVDEITRVAIGDWQIIGKERTWKEQHGGEI